MYENLTHFLNILLVLYFIFGGINQLLSFGYVIIGLIAYFFITSVIHKIKETSIKKQKKRHQLMMDERTLTYFSEHQTLMLNDHIKVCSNHAIGFDDLDVYYNDELVCKVKEFKYNFLDVYELIEQQLIEIEDVPESKSTISSKEETNDSILVQSLNEIYNINQLIEHPKIKEDLFHTLTMIKFILQIVNEYPQKKDKLTRLETIYIPALVEILKSYKRLMKTNRKDKDFIKVEEQLIKTIYLVNEALEHLSETLCDDEILDLSSDMDVLETMLKKDGLVKEGTLDEVKSRG